MLSLVVGVLWPQYNNWRYQKDYSVTRGGGIFSLFEVEMCLCLKPVELKYKTTFIPNWWTSSWFSHTLLFHRIKLLFLYIAVSRRYLNIYLSCQPYKIRNLYGCVLLLLGITHFFFIVIFKLQSLLVVPIYRIRWKVLKDISQVNVFLLHFLGLALWQCSDSAVLYTFWHSVIKCSLKSDSFPGEKETAGDARSPPETGQSRLWQGGHPHQVTSF